MTYFPDLMSIIVSGVVVVSKSLTQSTTPLPPELGGGSAKSWVTEPLGPLSLSSVVRGKCLGGDMSRGK